MKILPTNVRFPRAVFSSLVLLVQDRAYRSLADLATKAVLEWLQNEHPQSLPDPLPFIPVVPPRGRPVSLTSAPQVAVRLPHWLSGALKEARPGTPYPLLLREAITVWLENVHSDYQQRGFDLSPATPPPLPDTAARVMALEREVERLGGLVLHATARVSDLNTALDTAVARIAVLESSASHTRN